MHTRPPAGFLNLCFLSGKVVQAGTLSRAGGIRLEQVIANVPLTPAALAGLFMGVRVQKAHARGDVSARHPRHALRAGGAAFLAGRALALNLVRGL